MSRSDSSPHIRLGDLRKKAIGGIIARETGTLEAIDEMYGIACDLEEQLEAAQRGGAGLIAAERQRQMDAEGWTPEHDDRHDDGALARAACVYATDPDTRAELMLTPDGEENVNVPGSGYEPRHWPWEGGWKPTPDDRVRELVKAGALIAAEIDRLERAASSPAKRPS